MYQTRVTVCCGVSPAPPKFSVPLVGMSATIFYQHHQVPFDILKTRQELGSRGIHWSDFCGCPYPGYMWSRMIHSAARCLGLCVTSHCRARGLVCYRGLAGANFGIDLAWKKIVYAARQQLIKPLPLWMLPGSESYPVTSGRCPTSCPSCSKQRPIASDPCQRGHGGWLCMGTGKPSGLGWLKLRGPMLSVCIFTCRKKPHRTVITSRPGISANASGLPRRRGVRKDSCSQKEFWNHGVKGNTSIPTVAR